MNRYFWVLLLVALPWAKPARAWGFLAHRRINHLAVYTLPEPLRSFFKKHQEFLTEAAPNPDKRRNQDPTEAHKHYIDVDHRAFADSFLVYKNPAWPLAVGHYTEDTLNKYGTAPWQIKLVCSQLTEAFKAQNWERALYLAADLGHYAGDASVPLHTTDNYDGQLTGQRGVHSLWETTVVAQFYTDLTFIPGKAVYQPDVNARAWQTVWASHTAKDSVLDMERLVSKTIPVTEKSVTNDRGTRIIRSFSPEFVSAYHTALGSQVERRLNASIKLVGDLWYTCWMDAGQPTLPTEMGPEPTASAVPAPPEKGAKSQMKREED